MKNKIEEIEWVAVRQGLPDDEQRVLVHDDSDDVYMGYHDGAAWWGYTEDGVRNISLDGVKVLHWANVEGPLP